MRTIPHPRNPLAPRRSSRKSRRARGRFPHGCNSGEVAHDWALAGCGLIMKSWVDVATDVQAGRLVRVLPEWRSVPTPVCGLFPSSPRLPLRVRLFLDAMVMRLSSVEALPFSTGVRDRGTLAGLDDSLFERTAVNPKRDTHRRDQQRPTLRR